MTKRILITPKASQDSVKGFEKYLIFYLSFEDRILIVRILHSARDIERILKEE